MIEAFGQMLPFAVGVAISPTPIVAMVLMLITPQARSNGFVFILGWLVGVFAAGMIASIVIGLIGPGDGGAPATWTYWLKLVLGVLLALLAVREWRARPAPGTDVEMPGWMSALDSFTGPKAGGLAILLGGLNPKNLIFIVGAAAVLAPFGLSAVDQAIVWVVFTLIALYARLRADVLAQGDVWLPEGSNLQLTPGGMGMVTLLFSLVTVAWIVQALRNEDRGHALMAFGITLLLGFAYINGVARQPEARGVLQGIAILGFALAEALAIIGIGLAFVL